jgi:hypothetical protein
VPTVSPAAKAGLSHNTSDSAPSPPTVSPSEKVNVVVPNTASALTA